MSDGKKNILINSNDEVAPKVLGKFCMFVFYFIIIYKFLTLVLT